jgi:hypothetical protein
MTEAEWLICSDASQMLWDHLRSKISDRKMRLFGVACCRRIWHLITDKRSRNAVDVAERYADSLASEQEREDAWSGAYDANEAAYVPEMRYLTATQADFAADYAHHAALMASERKVSAAYEAANFAAQAVGEVTDSAAQIPGHAPSSKVEAGWQAMFVRDIVGNPFRTVTIKPSWLQSKNGIAREIAHAIYDEGAFDRMSNLADALEEAGCDNVEILSHLREPGLHVRGCWALDLILGKQ